MESRVNYTIVGLFVVILSTAMIFAGIWLTAGRHSQTYRTYLVNMKETVSGLSEQSPVKFNGVQVGYVKSIKLDRKNPQIVRILLNIAEDTPVTTSTRASLASQGITGVAYINLQAETPHAPPLQAKPGQRYAEIGANPSLLVQLDKAVRDVTENINTIAASFKQVFDENNIQAFSNTLENLDTFSTMLANNSKKMTTALDDATVLLDNAAKASKRFPEIANDFDNTLKSVKAASQQVRGAMKVGKKTIETFNSQALPSTIELIERLNNLSGNLDVLTTELRENPSMLVRGRAPSRPGPGEK